MMLLSVLATAACAALLTPSVHPARARLRSLGLLPHPPPSRGARRSAVLPRGPVAALAAIALLVTLPVPWNLLAAASAVVTVVVVSPRLDSASVRRERAAVARAMPLVCDLLAAAWAGGMAPHSALDVVAASAPGPAGRRLSEVAVRLRLGQSATAAWSCLDDDAADLVRVMVNAERRGTAVVDALKRLAVSQRSARRRTGEAAARSVAVRLVGPLGLCFLPAFVVLGIVPVVIGGLRPLLG